jgi:predicted HTH transcriptional regulator
VRIILDYGKNPSPTASKRKFVLKYSIRGRENIYYPHHLNRVIERFKKGHCDSAASRTPDIQGNTLSEELIKQYLEENPNSSNREIARQLDFSNNTIHKIIRLIKQI